MTAPQAIVGLTLSDVDNSPQRYVRISDQITGQITQLAWASIATDLQSTTAHVQQYQVVLRRFRNLSCWNLEDLVDAQPWLTPETLATSRWSEPMLPRTT